MQHTVYNLSYDHNGKVNKVLHRLRVLDTLTDANSPSKLTYEVSLNDGSEAIYKLTDREKQVLKLIAEGFSSKMIADILSISINTVETHRRHLLEKLEAKNSMELIRKAFRIIWN